MKNDATGDRPQVDPTAKSTTEIAPEPIFEFELKQLKLTEIDDHPINPKNRIERTSDLSADPFIKAGQLVNPLKVVAKDGKFVLLDGHRRKAALTLAVGEDCIVWCLVYTFAAECDPASIFASLNTKQKHRGDEKAAIYLVDPAFLSEQDCKSFKKAHDKLGNDGFIACVDARINPSRNADQLDRVVKRTGKSIEEVKSWFFAGTGPNTKSLRTFESHWNTANDKKNDNDPARVMARTCMRYAIETGSAFSIYDYLQAQKEGA